MNKIHQWAKEEGGGGDASFSGAGVSPRDTPAPVLLAMVGCIPQAQLGGGSEPRGTDADTRVGRSGASEQGAADSDPREPQRGLHAHEGRH